MKTKAGSVPSALTCASAPLNELRCRHAIRTTEYDTSDVGDARRPYGRSLRMGEAATVHRPFPGESSVGPDPLLQVLPELVISIR